MLNLADVRQGMVRALILGEEEACQHCNSSLVEADRFPSDSLVQPWGEWVEEA